MGDTPLSRKDLLPAELHQRIYQRHVQGAYMRTGAIFFLWFVLFVSFMFNVLDAKAFTGVTVTGLLVILANIPFLWGLKRIRHRILFEYYNISINVLEAVADAVIIYFLGGLRGMYLIFIFACLLAYLGIAAPRRYIVIIGIVCVVSFSAMVLLEHMGILAHQNLAWRVYDYTTSEVILALFCFAASLFVLIFTISYSADILKSTRAALKKRNEELEKSREAIDKAVNALRERNTILQESLERLQETQEQLLSAEKMAALGGIVAGVAHEVSTPLGVAVTAASFLEEKTREFSRNITESLAPGELKAFVDGISEAVATIMANLQRASDMIRNFKQVAVDQSSNLYRRFNFREYIDGVLLSLRFQYKRTGHKIEVDCPENLEVYGYPGLFSQIITNLVMNSLIHGLEDMKNGEIRIEVSETDDSLVLKYSDNGKGMEEAVAKRIFEPFFTTKRAQGGTGIGMSLVYKIVTETMGGRIKCDTAPGEGVCFTITIPYQKGILERVQ